MNHAEASVCGITHTRVGPPRSLVQQSLEARQDVRTLTMYFSAFDLRPEPQLGHVLLMQSLYRPFFLKHVLTESVQILPGEDMFYVFRARQLME